MNSSVQVCALAAADFSFAAIAVGILAGALVIGGAIGFASDVFPRLSGRRWLNPAAAAVGLAVAWWFVWLLAQPGEARRADLLTAVRQARAAMGKGNYPEARRLLANAEYRSENGIENDPR